VESDMVICTGPHGARRAVELRTTQKTLAMVWYCDYLS
jgi:hypothetical protein